MNQEAQYVIGDLVIDPVSGKVSRGAEEIPLPRLSYDLLLALARGWPKLLSIDELSSQVWSGLVISPETVSQRVKLLRDALGDDPKAPRYIAGVRGRGYQLKGPVTRQEGIQTATLSKPPSRGEGPEPVGGMPPATQASTRRAGLGWWRSSAVVLGVVILVGSGSVAWYFFSHSAQKREVVVTVAPAFNPPQNSVAVLAFTNMSGDPHQDYFSDGLSEELIDTLVRVNELQVAARTSAFSFKGSHADIPTVGRKLNVAAVLEGSVRRQGDQIRVSTQLINTSTGFTLWSEVIDRALSDVLPLQTDIAVRVASALKYRLVNEQQERLSIGITRNARALDAYFRGKRLLYEDNLATVAQGVHLLDEAIAFDPRFARAYGQRAGARVALMRQITDPAQRRAAHAEALSDAEREIALTPTSADGYDARAYVFTFGAVQNVSVAILDLERARALEPGNSGIQARYALLAGALGRPDALDAANRAVLLDPLNPDSYNGRSAVFHYQRRYAASLQDAQAAIRLQNHLYYRNSAFLALVGLGRLQEALELSRNDDNDWEVRAMRLMVKGELGNRKEAEAELKTIQQKLGDDDAYLYAGIYAQWGEREEAMRWLEIAVRNKAGINEIRTDPMVDPIRGDPRFKALEASLNLPR